MAAAMQGYRSGPTLDPGRIELLSECSAASSGELLASSVLIGGGRLEVTSHCASAQEGLPPGAPEGARQEWRVLRFLGGSGAPSGERLAQSITKVCTAPRRSRQVGEAEGVAEVRLRADCLVLPYTKTFASVALATLSALETPVLSDDFGDPEERLRVLCVGLGGGSVPAFLAHLLPHCEVDCVELEPAVVKAAKSAMGFEEGPRLRVYVEDGAAFALQQAGAGRSYDAVLVDAYLSDGSVPEALWRPGGGFTQALADGLLRERGLVAINLKHPLDPSGPLVAYRRALEGTGKAVCWGFSVREPTQALDGYGLRGEGNSVAVLARGGKAVESSEELAAILFDAADEVQEAVRCPFAGQFSMANLASLGLRLWPEL